MAQRLNSHLGRCVITLVLGAAMLASMAASAAAAPRVDRSGIALTGSVGDAVVDGTCPHDQYFPTLVEPHQHYDAAGRIFFLRFTLSVDVCISSDGGALGGHSFVGGYTLRTLFGAIRGSASGTETNLPNEEFRMTLQFGHSHQAIFQGCFPGFSGPLIDAELTTSAASGPTCGLPPS